MNEYRNCDYQDCGKQNNNSENPNERVRIVDIAEELGVSTATVSNVLHGKTKKISYNTIKRVQEKLEERGYIPNMAGILLAQNNSRIVGVIINNHEKYENHVLEDAFVSASLNALSLELDAAGLFMMVKVIADWNEIVRIASMWNMEGLVLIGFCAQDYQKLRGSMHIPYVVYDGYVENIDRFCNITIDNYCGGWQAGTYLKKMGHKSVLCIADNNICMDKERIDGFRESLAGENVDFWQIPMQRAQRKSFYRERIQEIKGYTAVFAVSDYYAIELMRFLQEQGVDVPTQISIIGFDDSPWCGHVYPTLTTIRQNLAERARQAVSMLQQLKQGICQKTTIVLPVCLIERGSVKRI